MCAFDAVRCTSDVPPQAELAEEANARLRHTFGTDMVRAGVSIPALMRLMGHANIQTTLIYVEVTPIDVYQQYARAAAQLVRPIPVTP